MLPFLTECLISSDVRGRGWVISKKKLLHSKNCLKNNRARGAMGKNRASAFYCPCPAVFDIKKKKTITQQKLMHNLKLRKQIMPQKIAPNPAPPPPPCLRRTVLIRETGTVHCSVCFVVLITLHSVVGCASPGGKCASNPCPVGYKCADFSQGFQCKCVDSSKCDLEKSGCVDRLCITGM